MTSQDDYFLELKEWSKRKLKIIQKYLDGFTRILGSFYRGPVYYVDGFAGRGIYDGGERGSPVLAAELAENYRDTNRAYRLKCINVEKSQDNYDNLVTETMRFGNLVENYPGTLVENLDKILRKIGDAPALFFLDDFGVKGTEWGAVERVISQKNKIDMWIRFDHKTVRRLHGFFDSSAKDAQNKTILLEQFFCISDLSELRNLLNGPTQEARIQNSVDLYLRCLEETYKKYKKSGFAASYPIVSVDGQRKYHLVFTCSHYKAATLASNVVNSVEETFQVELQEYKERQTQRLSLFPLEPTAEKIMAEKVDRLKEEICKLPKGQTMIREAAHYQVLLNDKYWFGKIGRRHLTQALKALLAEPSPRINCNVTPGRDDVKVTVL